MRRKRKPPAPRPQQQTTLVSWKYLRAVKREMDAWDSLPKHVRDSLEMESYQSPPFATGMRDALAAGFDWKEFASLFKKNSHMLYQDALRAASTPTAKEKEKAYYDEAAEIADYSVSFDPPRAAVDE